MIDAVANAMNPSAAPTALVVEPNVSSRLRIVETLAAAGFHVTALDAFEAARRQIVSDPPAVLVTALKLGEYNGFHLVLRVKTASPRTAALVTSDDGGAVFRREAQQASATLLVDPVTSDDLLAAVLRTLFRADSSISIEAPFERRLAERRRSVGRHEPDRRSRDRRRDLETLLLAAV